MGRPIYSDIINAMLHAGLSIAQADALYKQLIAKWSLAEIEYALLWNGEPRRAEIRDLARQHEVLLA